MFHTFPSDDSNYNKNLHVILILQREHVSLHWFFWPRKYVLFVDYQRSYMRYGSDWRPLPLIMVTWPITGDLKWHGPVFHCPTKSNAMPCTIGLLENRSSSGCKGLSLFYMSAWDVIAKKLTQIMREPNGRKLKVTNKCLIVRSNSAAA